MAEPTPTTRMRIARFLAAAGLASRRASEELVRAGRVTVNGTLVETPAMSVDPVADRVCCDGRPLALSAHRCFMLHKPPGYTCSARDEHAEHVVGELVPPELGRLFTVGRLDRDSEGLLLLTNDGDLAQSLTHPRYEVPRVYRVWVRGRVTAAGLAALCRGVHDQGEFLQARRATLAEPPAGGDAVLEIVVAEGRKREVRRLCRSQGWGVVRLVRTALGPLRLGDLAAGDLRALSEAELADLQRPAGGATAGRPPPAARG